MKNLKYDLHNLSNWLNANKISLNATKTELLIFKHPNKIINYNVKAKLNGKLLRPSDYVKYLGIYIDPNLNWKINTNILASQLSRSIGMLSKLRHYVTTDTLRSIFCNIFFSFIIWISNLGSKFLQSKC